jgi:hypothetical protein
MNNIENFVEERFNQLQRYPSMWGNSSMIESVCFGWLDVYVFSRTGNEKTMIVILDALKKTKMRLYPSSSINVGFATTVHDFEQDDSKAEAMVAAAYLEMFRCIKGKFDNE